MDTLNTCDEQDALVSYLYDDLEPGARARFEAHLASCAECRGSLEGMRGVRAQLATWQLPEGAGAGAGAGTAGLKTGGYTSREGHAYTRPWWAPGAWAAAAVILLAAAAAIANLEITYGRDGISVRTGWSRTSAGATQTTTAAAPSQPAGAQKVDAQTVSARDLSALEKRLRTEFQALAVTSSAKASPDSGTTNATAASPAASAQLLKRVQDLLDQSETRQRRELALRVAQVVRDFDTQRQTDLVRIQQGLGQIEGTTAADRQVLNYLVRASQRQDK